MKFQVIRIKSNITLFFDFICYNEKKGGKLWGKIF